MKTITIVLSDDGKASAALKGPKDDPWNMRDVHKAQRAVLLGFRKWRIDFILAKQAAEREKETGNAE